MEAPARLWPVAGSDMWQATLRTTPGSGAFNSGTAVSHTASENAHRVRKRHPEGGLIGFGGSPMSGASAVR
jgi:hypothetical protein